MKARPYLSPLFEKLALGNMETDLLICPWADSEALPQSHPNPKSLSRLDPQKAVALVIAEHERLGLNPPQAQALDALYQGNVILTGQQAVIGGGPMLIWEKAATAQALAEKWTDLASQDQNPENWCALFWIAGDDSDWAEALHMESCLEGPKPPWKDPENPSPVPDGTMIGAYQLSETQLQNLARWWSEWSALIPSEQLAKIQAGPSLVHQIARLMEFFFDGKLLIVDGASPQIRQTAQVFLQELDHRAPEIEGALLKQEAQIQAASLPVQVPHRPGTKRLFATDGTLRSRTPQLPQGQAWTHDALSRPLLCAWLWSTACHILGPGELRYFLQLQDLWSLLNLRIPAIRSRMSAVWMRATDRELNIQLSQDPWFPPQGELNHWLEFLGQDSQEQASYAIWSQHLAVAEASSSEPTELPPLPQALGQKWLHQYSHWIRKKARQRARQLPQGIQAQQTWRWLGSGRPQDRILSPLELLSQGASFKDLQALDAQLQVMHLPPEV
jgi:hypothetical protein